MGAIAFLSRPLLAGLLLLVPLAGAQDAAPEPLADVAFTVSVTDADTTPMAAESYDVTEVALGEPGDGTVVFRGTLAGSPDGQNGVFFFGFTSGAGDVVGGCTFAGAPTTRNIGEAVPPGACVLAGTAVYAIYPYEDIEAAVGEPITQIWAFTDVCTPRGCVPGDTAPGNLIDDWPSTTFGTDYTPTGCTRASGCASGAPLRVFKDANGTRLNETFVTPTNVTIQYNVTWPHPDGRLAWGADVTAGSVNVTVLDAGNATVANFTVGGSGNATVDFQGAEAGGWTVRLNFTAFAGRLNVTLGPAPAPPSATSTSTSGEPNDDTRTGTFPLRKTDKGTPGLGMPLLLAVTAAAAVLVRRRAA
jgi:hypothetical protein